MEIKELISKLQEVEQINPNATVYIDGEYEEGTLKGQRGMHDFKGFNVDDICDVTLDQCCGDKPA